ncbi:MAG: mandelate racemase/muconate lactonizing enzyme family protein [Caldilineaceae bacterium]|nr:mandelate racemase/muconate lactonizing enzyme family protein [Caldilineaceae bacterium]
MKIARIVCTLLTYPLPAPLHPSWAPGRTFTSTSCTLVEITSDDGITGVGAMPQTGHVGLYTIADMVAPYILGRDVHAVERISPILRSAARDGSYPWAVEMALWDILGQASGMPVYQLWGGFQRTLPVYASLAEIVSAGEQIDRLHLLNERGFRAFKLRLRRPTIAEDIAFVEKIRAEFGDSVDLMVDANQAHVMPSPGPHNFWNYTDALTVAQAMHDLGVLWLEEPLPRYNYEQLAQLTAATDIPIAGGELNIGLNEYRDLILRNCYDIIQADAAFSEGIFQLRKVAAMAEMCYKRFIPHTWSNGVGLGANLHLAMSLPNCPWFEFPIDPPAWTDEARDFMLTTPYDVDADGTITVPNAPGLGIELDRERIRQYTVAVWESGER